MEKSLIRIHQKIRQNITGITMITNTTTMEATINWSATINRSLQYNLLGVVTNSNYINYPRYVRVFYAKMNDDGSHSD